MDRYATYFDGGLNADDDFELIKSGQWVNGSNIRVFSTDKGSVNRVEAVGGSALLFNNLPAGTNRCIGGCEDEGNSRMLFFNWNSNGNHGVYCYYTSTGIGYQVMMSADVIGGLGFSRYQYIHSCGVANGIIYWVNSTNSQPRRINIEAGIKAYAPTFITTFIAYSLPVKQSVISWIRKPGGLPPTMAKQTQTSPVIVYNFIRYAAFQFCYRYNYRDYESSTLSPYTETANYNATEDTYNCIDIALPYFEDIEQDVLSIDLVARFMESDQYFIIKTWIKTDTANAAEIAAHNAKTTLLNYRFYNSTSGEALNDVYKKTLFQSIPQYVQTMAIAKNRAFFANYWEGQNTPEQTSLAVSYNTLTIGSNGFATIVGTWCRLFIQKPGSGSPSQTFWILRTTVPFGPLAPAAVYYYKLPDAVVVPPYPLTVSVSDLTFVGSNTIHVRGYYISNILPADWIYASAAITPIADTSTVTGGSAPGMFLSRAFKSGASYQIGITFFDEYQRKCGVKTKDSLIINVPSAMVNNNYVVFLDWVLSNTNALTEIPDWAHYYSIDITECLTTRFFLQGAGTAIYAEKNSAGAYTFVATAYANYRAGIAVDITSLEAYKMGYTFNEGDVARLKIGSTEHQLSVIAVDGKYVILELKDIGTLSPTDVTFELYTPYKKSATELFYEVGNLFLINNPGNILRTYSNVTGTISGDIYLLSRSYFAANIVTEAMNVNDKFWKNWFANIGRPNKIDTIGKKKLTGNIKWTDVFLEGTKVNGLSSFQPLNTITLGSENGAAIKLQLASKVQTDGSVLLALCEKETVSCLLGEQEIFDSQGNSFIAKSDNVIGSFKALQKGMGTRHPESVFENNGLVFFYDQANSAYVQYSNNGLDAISNYKMTRPVNLFSQKLATLSTAQIELLGSDAYVIGGYDPHHQEVLFSIPSTEAVAPKGLLEDYGTDYPYDIYDGKGKTLMFKDQQNKWIGSMHFEAEKFITIDNNLYAFKNGGLFKMNSEQKANFFGVQHTAKLMFSANPGNIRTFASIALDGNKKPSFIHFRTEDPYVQSSDLVADDFREKEGRKWSPVLRNRLDPNAAGDYMDKMFSGEKLIGKFLLVMLEFNFDGFDTFDDSFDETFTADGGDNLPLELRFATILNIVN